MKTIYRAIKKRLEETVPSLREVSLDTGQLSVSWGETGRPPVALPACLITVDIVRAEDVTSYVQQCRARVTLTLVTDLVPAGSEEEPYEQAVEIYRALQGWGTEDFAPLTRLSAMRERRSDARRLFTHRTVMETTFIDESAEELVVSSE